MHKASLAEWILSRTTTSEHAQTILGDLIEQEPSRGVIWFWNSILRIAVAFSFRDRRAPGWSLLREVSDTAVLVLLIGEFVSKGWLGFLYMLIGNLAWVLLTGKIFRGPALHGHLLFRMGLAIAIASVMVFLHVGG